MENASNITEIAIVVMVALTGGLVLARLKQPPILGYVLAGVLLGPSGMELVQSRESVTTLADLGILEIFPISALISVEMDAFLITDDERLQVYSSHKRLNLTQQRLAK